MNLDKSLLFKINNLVGKNKIFDNFGFFGGRYLLYVMIIFLVVYINYTQLYDLKKVLEYLQIFIILWLSAWIISLLIGAIVRRKRPYLEYPDKIKSMYVPIFGKWKSMPSDHAMTCGVLISLLGFLSASWIIIGIFVILSLWVCWGRLYASVHYLSDILIGFLVSIVSVILLYTFIYLAMYL